MYFFMETYGESVFYISYPNLEFIRNNLEKCFLHSIQISSNSSKDFYIKSQQLGPR